MPFAQLMAVLPLRDVACSLRVPSNPNGLKYNKDENETVIAHRSDCGLFLFRQKKGVRQWMSNSKLIELSYPPPFIEEERQFQLPLFRHSRHGASLNKNPPISAVTAAIDG